MKNRLREIRLTKGLTLAEVAAKADTTATQLSRLETGRRSLDMKWIDRLSKALEINPEEIFGTAYDGEEIFLEEIVTEIGPQPPVIVFLSKCHNRVLNFRRISPVELQTYLDHEQCFRIATMLTASFFPLFEKVGLTKELDATLSFYTAHTAVTEALADGDADVLRAAMFMKSRHFKYLDPEEDLLGKEVRKRLNRT